MFTKKGHVDVKRTSVKFLDSKRESAKRLKDLKILMGQSYLLQNDAVVKHTHTEHTLVPIVFSLFFLSSCRLSSCHHLLLHVINMLLFIFFPPSYFVMMQKTVNQWKRENCLNIITVTSISSSSTHCVVLRADSKSKVLNSHSIHLLYPHSHSFLPIRCVSHMTNNEQRNSTETGERRTRLRPFSI